MKTLTRHQKALFDAFGDPNEKPVWGVGMHFLPDTAKNARARANRAKLAQAKKLRPDYDDPDTITAIQSYMARVGLLPTWREVNTGLVKLGVGPQRIIQHYGTWNTAVKMAGYEPRRSGGQDDNTNRVRAEPSAPRPRPVERITSYRCQSCNALSATPVCPQCQAVINPILLAEQQGAA